MREIYLVRHWYSDQGTFGQLITEGFRCVTVEPPWRDNKPNYSCIPTGNYECKLIYSRRFGWVYTIEGIEERDLVRIHSGNLAGDIRKGFITHSSGCVLLGKRFGILGNQHAVLCSRPTIRALRHAIQGLPFTLHIIKINI